MQAMKIKSLLFIALIGMVGATAFATTSEPEKKSKTDFKNEYHVSGTAFELPANVDFSATYDVVKTNVTPEQIQFFQVTATKKVVSTTFTTVAWDVGWHPEKVCNYDVAPPNYVTRQSNIKPPLIT